MKIAILTDQIGNSGGGAGVVAWNHARALVARGHEVIVVSVCQIKGQVGSTEEGGITIHRLYSNYPLGLRAYVSLNNRRVVKKVGKILKAFGPDIVHSHNIHLDLSYAVLKEAKKYSKALFHTVHDSMPFHYSKLFPETVDTNKDTGEVVSYKVSAFKQLMLFRTMYNPFRNRIIKKYLKCPTKIFAVSTALARALSDNGIGNVEVLHNGIDVKEWGGSVDASPDERKFVFFGGRLSAAKGATALMSVMRDVCSQKIEARLLVVGEINEFSLRMQKQAQEFGIEDQVLFAGKKNREEMKHMYALATIVVVPSLCFDWFPTNILEAMASKKPVIATCFGGSREMVENGLTGYIVNPENSNELADKILTLIANPLIVQKMGEAGYERVKSEFSMERHITSLLAWYDNSLK